VIGTYTFFAFPDLNARIGLALNGDTIAVTFLSEGTSRSGAGEYKRRNPDRRKAFDRLIRHPLFRPHTARGGKAANPPEPVAPWPWDGVFDPSVGKAGGPVLKAFRQGGNYRFDCWLSLDRDLWGGQSAPSPSLSLPDIAESMGLEPTKNRPVAVRWLDNPSHENNPLHTIGGVK
jgi:hypothetical protein